MQSTRIFLASPTKPPGTRRWRTYLRGLTTLLAATVEFKDDRVTRMNETASRQRIDAAVCKARQSQLAAARGCIQTICVGEFRETIPC